MMLNLAVSKDQLKLGRGSAGYDWYVMGQNKLLMCGDGSWDRTSHGMILQKRSIRFTYPYSKQMMPQEVGPVPSGGDVWWYHHIHSLCVAVCPCPRSSGVFSLKSNWIDLDRNHWIYRPNNICWSQFHHCWQRSYFLNQTYFLGQTLHVTCWNHLTSFIFFTQDPLFVWSKSYRSRVSLV